MKTVIQIILGVVIIAMFYLVFKSIEKPIIFQNKKDKRYAAVVQSLKDIRSAQVAYKSLNKKYAADFDTLINFVKTAQLPLVKAIGHVPDSLTEEKAVELGIVKRDTLYVSVLDSLFSPKKRPHFSIDSLPFIPFAHGEKFEMGAGEVESGKVKVKVFEAKALNKIILNGLNKQEIININAEQKKLNRYKGLKVGSLEESNNNAGNWE